MSLKRPGDDTPTHVRCEADYRAVVERYTDTTDQCTIFPTDTAGDEQTTRWITALEPHFVDLREFR